MARIFISCVTAEFGAYRVEIAKYFRRAECEVRTQEDFSQIPEDTIQKLDAYIRSCDAVIHIIGEGAGAVADSKAVASFLKSERGFAEKMKELGDFQTLQISYTHWEAFLAAYYGKPIFVYQASVPIRDGNPTKACGFDKDWPIFRTQHSDVELVAQHCSRLKQLPTRRYSSPFKNLADLNGQFIGDLHRILGPKVHASIVLHERFGAHKVDELRNLLRTMATPLLKEGFILASFVQISGAIPDVVGHDRSLDLALIEVLAERQSPHDLLAMVKACELRSVALGLEELSRALASWFFAALGAFNASQKAKNASIPPSLGEDLTEAAVMGRCAEAFHFLKPDSFAKPSLEIAWRQHGIAPNRQVNAESYLRWGRCRQQASLGGVGTATEDNEPTRLVRSVLNSKQFRNVPFDRLDVFVSREELNRPWEYAAGCNSDDEDAQLFPWPLVVRLLGRELLFSITKPPPDPFSRLRLACLLGRCDTFMADVRERGAFFAAPAGHEDGAAVFGRAATHASLGFWIRTAKPLEEAEECLKALEGQAFAAIPRLVFEKKLGSPKGTAWHDMSVLYDHPEWPAFEFSEDQFQLPDHEQMLRAVT